MVEEMTDIPADVNDEYLEVYKRLKLLKSKKFTPDFVIDVGASSGCWSYHARMVYPDIRYILVEPLAAWYKERPYWVAESYPEFELVSKAVSDQPGRVSFNVALDLCSSSVFGLDESQLDRRIDAEATTLDRIANEKNLAGRGLLKMDIQFAEHVALQGATEVLEQIDVVIMEVTLLRYYPNCKVFIEVLQLMDGLGFQYFDDAGEYRRPDGVLSHKDVVFVRKTFVVSYGLIQEPS